MEVRCDEMVRMMVYAEDADDDGEEKPGWRRLPSQATPLHPLQEPSDSNLDQGRVWGINIYITSKLPSSNCSYIFCTKKCNYTRHHSLQDQRYRMLLKKYHPVHLEWQNSYCCKTRGNVSLQMKPFLARTKSNCKVMGKRLPHLRELQAWNFVCHV